MSRAWERMGKLERWTMSAGAAAVTATGVVYVWMKYLMHSDDPLAVINHPWQPAVLKLHILTAPILVFGLGLIAVRHVLAHWRGGTRTARRTGLTALAAVLPMILTGYLIEVFTSIRWLSATAWAHIGTGLLFAAGFGLHQVVWRTDRQRRALTRAPRHPPAAR
jgi:hypothetical protein